MIETILLVMVLVLGLASMPLPAFRPGGAADSGGGDGADSAGGTDDAGDAGASGDAAAGGAEGTPPAGGAADAGDQSAGDLVRAALGPAASDTPPAPRPAQAAQPADGVRPGDVLNRLGLAERFSQQFGQLPPELQQQVSTLTEDFLREWYERRYFPAAAMVRDEHAQLSQRREELTQYQQSLVEFVSHPVYETAAYLYENPEVLQQVQAFLQGGGSEQQPQLDLDKLDPETRLVYERATAAEQRAAELEQRMAEWEQYRAQQEQASEQARAAQWQQTVQAEAQRTRSELGQLVQQHSRRLGLRLQDHAPQYQRLGEYIRAQLAYRKQLRDSGQPVEKLDLAKIVADGVRHAGYAALAKRRRQQAATSAAAPDGRAGRPVEDSSAQSLVRSALGQLNGAQR